MKKIAVISQIGITKNDVIGHGNVEQQYRKGKCIQNLRLRGVSAIEDFETSSTGGLR